MIISKDSFYFFENLISFWFIPLFSSFTHFFISKDNRCIELKLWITKNYFSKVSKFGLMCDIIYLSYIMNGYISHLDVYAFILELRSQNLWSCKKLQRQAAMESTIRKPIGFQLYTPEGCYHSIWIMSTGYSSKSNQYNQSNTLCDTIRWRHQFEYG